jgi:exosortase
MTPPASRCTAFRALPWLAKVDLLGLGAAVAAFAALLWPQWLHDDDLTHGIFLPFLALILAAESRRDPSPRFVRPGAAPLAACLLLVLASLASLAVAITYAAAMGWSHAMAEFMASTALVLALGAGWLAFADQRVRFLPVNWAAGVAVVLWLFASPPPPGTYARLASFLQAEVTHGVVWVLSAVGIAAFQEGNVIELARTSVGVSEACSGVRSLISCTVAGLFLSAVLVRRPAHRALVIAVSPAIGLAMNFLRSLLLTLLANAGVSIEGRWHDLTGASIIVVTTLLVGALAFRLHRLEPIPAQARREDGPPGLGRSPLPGIVAAALLLAAGIGAALAEAGRAQGVAQASAPNLGALFPEAPPGWTVQTTPNFEQFSGILHTHALVERVYSAGDSQKSAHVTLYIAYWRPGQASVSLVDAHTPDACWPGTGWELLPLPSGRQALGVGGRVLAPAECRLFSHGTFETRVWFWHLYGGRPLTFVDPYSAVRLLGLAWRYGFGHAEDQLFVRVSSDRPWQEIASQPVLRQFFENLKPLGL